MVELSREEYPFSSHFLQIESNRYHYIDEGPRDAKPILMVHGNPTWSFYYRKLVKALSQKHRVIVPDHMGCGLSDKPATYNYCLANHISNLTALIEHLDLKDISLVVHDWGGAIGFGAAIDCPERMTRFAVFNTAAFFVPRVPFRIRMCRWPLLGPFMVRGLNGFVRAAFLFATNQPDRFTGVVREGYEAPYDSWENRVAIHAFVKDIPLEHGHPTRPVLDRIEANLAQFKDHPMTLIWGAKDFCFTEREFLPEWQKRFPGADVHVIEEAGHYVVEDAFETILPILNAFI